MISNLYIFRFENGVKQGNKLKMKFPRGTALKLPKRAFKKNSVDPEKFSFFIVIGFFAIFGIIILVEFLFKEQDEYDYTVD